MSAWTVPGYREVRELGAGGAGRVVLATYASTGAYVAIKYLRDELREDPRFLTAFRREARVMVELEDPNIVRLYEYVETPHGAAIVMELVDGVPLRRILAEHGTTSPEAALVVLKGSLAGLSRAHANGVVHRDYKPENVLIQADGMSKLSDFGIASPSGVSGLSAGTPSYMAPEQWAGGPPSPATDVYAATCVFFECLTGHRPYRADHPAGLRHAHQSAPIPSGEVPGSVRALVQKGLAKNPSDRPPTARAFVSDLETAALAAYGADWEQRGRRHLAELATLLALLFPLAKPSATPEVSTSLARTVLRGRLAQFAPRFAIGGAVLAAVVIAGVIAARGQTPVAEDSLLTPTPTVQEALPPGTDQEPGTPVTDGPTATDEPTVEPTNTTSPSGKPTHKPVTTPTKPAVVITPTVKPPTKTPSTKPSPTPTPTAHAVTGLAITAFDGQSGTISVTATTTKKVTLGVRWSEGSSPSKLVAAKPQSIPLAGALSYKPSVQHAFATPKCGTTVYRRLEAATLPKAPGGTASKVMKIVGPACPPPSVTSASITGWDGDTVSVALKTGNQARVKVLAAFIRDGQVVDNAFGNVSGRTDYKVQLSGDLGKVECGKVAVFGVRVTTEPAAGNGPQTRELRVPGEACPPPVVSVSSWDGSSLTIHVTASTTDDIRVAISYNQKVVFQEQTINNTKTDSATLSGAKSYDRSFSVTFRDPSDCGLEDTRTVTVTLTPGGKSDSASKVLSFPSCGGVIE